MLCNLALDLELDCVAERLGDENRVLSISLLSSVTSAQTWTSASLLLGDLDNEVDGTPEVLDLNVLFAEFSGEVKLDRI